MAVATRVVCNEMGYTLPGLVDFVGRQENLCEDLIQVLRLRGHEFDPDFVRSYDSVNVSNAPPMSIEWDPALRERMIQLEYPALVRHGYVA